MVHVYALSLNSLEGTEGFSCGNQTNVRTKKEIHSQLQQYHTILPWFSSLQEGSERRPQSIIYTATPQKVAFHQKNEKSDVQDAHILNILYRQTHLYHNVYHKAMLIFDKREQQLVVIKMNSSNVLCLVSHDGRITSPKQDDLQEDHPITCQICVELMQSNQKFNYNSNNVHPFL